MKAVLVFFVVVSNFFGVVYADFAKMVERGSASAICVAQDSGLVIFEHNADEVRAPASMVKLMLMLMAAEGLEKGEWALDKVITVSANAQRMGGTQIYLEKGERWKVKDLMAAICVASANDASMALAEGLWGSEDKYLAAMNKRAKELGMKSSTFRSVHGLPPDRGEKPDETTARDMALLAVYCTKQPAIMDWVDQKTLRLRGGKFVKANTNKLLWRMKECDGLKTGYTVAAGWCLAASAKRGDTRIVAVVMGCDSKKGRFEIAKKILENGFDNCERVRVMAKGAKVEPAVPVENCAKEQINLVAGRDIWLTIPKRCKSKVVITADIPDMLRPPMDAGSVLAEGRVTINGNQLAKAELLLPESLEPASVRWKIVQAVLGQMESSELAGAGDIFPMTGPLNSE